MAERKASIKLDLKAEAFATGMKWAQRSAQQAAEQSGSAWKRGLEAGAKGGLQAIQGMFGTIRRGMTTLAGLAGGIGFGSLIKSAVDADEKFRALSFTVSAGTGKFVAASALQDKAQQSAIRWGVQNERLADSLAEVFNTVGDLEFSSAVLDDIAKASRASGKPVEVLAKLVAEANRQFGVTADEAPQALADIMSLASRGGLSLEDLGAQMGLLGSLASQAGLKGREGMGKMLGMANTISAASGRSRAAVSDLNMALIRLQDAATMQTVKKSLKLDLSKEGDSISRLEAVLRATKGEATGLTQVFGADLGLTVARAFGEPLRDVMSATTGTEKQKLDAGIDSFRQQLKDAARSSLDASDVAKKAEENRLSAQAQIEAGVERFKKAFTKPEMMAAIEKLAEQMPKLADALASLLDVVMDQPIMSAGVLVGGQALKGGLSATMSNAMQQQIMTGGNQAAGAMGKSITTASASGAKALGGSIAGAFAPALAAIGVSAALDQGTKLAGDLDQYRKDVAGERETLTSQGRKLGQSTVTREKSAAEMIFGSEGEGLGQIGLGAIGGGGLGAALVGGARALFGERTETLDTGAIAGGDLSQRDVMGKVIVKQLEREQAAADAARRMAGPQRVAFSDVQAQAEQRFGRALSPAEQERLMNIRTGFGAGAAPGQEGANAAIQELGRTMGRSGRETATAVRTALAGELRVRVVNPEEISTGKKPKAGSDPID